jgi:hypothetical protein
MKHLTEVINEKLILSKNSNNLDKELLIKFDKNKFYNLKLYYDGQLDFKKWFYNMLVKTGVMDIKEKNKFKKEVAIYADGGYMVDVDKTIYTVKLDGTQTWCEAYIELLKYLRDKYSNKYKFNDV